VEQKFGQPAVTWQADLWRHIALLAQARSSVTAAGLRARIEKTATDHPKAWASSLDWLLAVGTHLDDLDIYVTMTLMQKHPSVRAALKRSTTSAVPEVRMRANGIKALSAGSGPIEEKLIEALSQSFDARRHVFPRPLELPSSTWLSSYDLEDLIRRGVSSAVSDFASFVAQAGSQDEEQLTANLLHQLGRHLTTASTAGRRLAPGAPEVAVASRQETKHAERGTGADVGIVLDIDMPGRMETRIGDLVQVKKADALIPSAPERDAWKIDRDQLATLLEHSATACYWLIPESGHLYVLPAKFLAAIGAATGGSASSFTVGHTMVRNSAIGLEQYLTDMITGLWLGGSGTALEAASGQDRRNRPAFFLRINVTLPLLDAPYRTSIGW
jgi:hypothetical protein